MARFMRYIGIDYSGAATPTSGLKGLRVFLATEKKGAIEVLPPVGGSKYWSRRGVALWLADRLAEDISTVVGIDHGFSFPLRYFEQHNIPLDWSTFLDDFEHHWPTAGDKTFVDHVRDGSIGNGAARLGNPRWRRECELRCRGKSVFHFDVQGSVAKSTHAGLPWIRFLRQNQGRRLHCWPFDGWVVPDEGSVVLEAYPAVYKKDYPTGDLTPDQHDAFSVAQWLRDADQDGRLAAALQPELSIEERRLAAIEGWILGVK
jgi:hypothetical protein